MSKEQFLMKETVCGAQRPTLSAFGTRENSDMIHGQPAMPYTNAWQGKSEGGRASPVTLV